MLLIKYKFMGVRISIQFQKGEEKSVVLFSHWGGTEFLNTAEDYALDLKKWAEKYERTDPLGRKEPRTVMVDFIRHITTAMDRVTHDLYLGKDETDGDNSDYGHHVINLD
jgi:hypothetical protein